MTDRPQVLVVGGGITGLAAAYELTQHHGVDVELREGDERLGGKIATSAFAGVDRVDEAADAFLTRVPSALGLCREVGLADDQLTSPTSATAAVWHDGLHEIPDGLLLGVPASVLPFVRTGLLSWRGKLRAAIEPLLPVTDPDDSIGALVRARFGDEVHERLVDALVGSIYATDTDQSSLRAVPQLAALATEHRSLLLGARSMRKRTPSTGAPIFAAPRNGLDGLIGAVARRIETGGGTVATGRPIATLQADGTRWRVDDDPFDAVIFATPARATASLLRGTAPSSADALDGIEASDVIMVRLAVPGEAWPERLTGRSGYLVPKPDQRFVTAASFASQKWAHWRPADGSQILRASLGRDGLAVAHLDDEQVLEVTVDEVGRHLDIDFQPTAASIHRWIDAFPQYRPHHHERVVEIEAGLPPSIAVAGASYRGIGVPACIADGRSAALRIVERLGAAVR